MHIETLISEWKLKDAFPVTVRSFKHHRLTSEIKLTFGAKSIEIYFHQDVFFFEYLNQLFFQMSTL